MIDNKFYKDLDYEYTRYPRYEQNILNIHIGTWMLFFFSMFFSMNFMKNIYILAIGTLLIILTYIIYINIYKKFMKNLNEIKNNNDSELDDFINDDNIIVSNIMNEINVDDNAKEMFKKTLIKSIREDNQNFFDFIESKIIIKGAVDINVLKNFYENTDLKLNTNIKVID